MLFRIYIIEGLEKSYLKEWHIVDGLDCLVFTMDAKHAMRFKDSQTVNDYLYQLRANGHQPRVEAIRN